MRDDGHNHRVFHYGLVILMVSLLVVTGAVGFVRFGYTMILPYMKEGLVFTNTQMGLLATGNFVGYLLFALIGGYLASKYGPRMIIACSLLVTGISLYLTGLASNFEFAFIMRTLTGIGSGAANIPVLGLAAAWFAPNRRGMALGVIIGGTGLGLVIVGFLVPAIIKAYGTVGWRYSWYYLGFIVLSLAFLSYAFLRNNPAEKGVSPIGRDNQSTKQEAPRLPTSGWGNVYRLPGLWHLGLIDLMFGFSYIIYATFFTTYLVGEVGVTSSRAGSLWALVGVLSIVSGFVWGILSDLIGRRWGLMIPLSLQTLSFLIFAFAQSSVGFFSSAVLFGLTAWSIPSIVSAACGDYVGPGLAPAALGFITVIFGIGQAMGPFLGGVLADFTSSFSAAFLAAAGAAFIGAVGSSLLKTNRRE